MTGNVSSAAAPYGSIGGHAYVSAKQATASQAALDKAANSATQKGNDATIARLKNAANAPAPVTSFASAAKSSSTAVVAQNVDGQTSGKASATPYGKIGNHEFVSAEQAAKVKEALGSAGASLITPAGGKPQSATAATSTSTATGTQDASKALANLNKAIEAYRGYKK